MHGTDLPELPAEPGVTFAPSGFAVVTHLCPDGTELALLGELDQATRPIFDAAVGAALRDGPPALRLELSGLGFLAVAGGHAFEEAHDRCVRAGGRLVVANPARPVLRLLTLFELTHLVVGG